MSKYRKKPVVIEAYQTNVAVEIETLEGTMRASPGDWIITGVNGEKYPCKPDIFAKTYEDADEERQRARLPENLVERVRDMKRRGLMVDDQEIADLLRDILAWHEQQKGEKE